MTAVTVRALPARCGDCIVIEYGSTEHRPFRILVDGGLKGSYNDGLGKYLSESVDQPTTFDVVVVTHIDLDHIEGVIEALDRGQLTTENIWFNGRAQLLDLLTTPTSDRGALQGDALDKLIPANKRNPAFTAAAIHVPMSGPAETHELPGSARCTLLSPSTDRLRALLKKWPEPTRGETHIDLCRAFDDDDDAGEGDTRGVGVFGKDSSVANGSSIAFLLEIADVKLLLTGDAYASDLQATIQQLLDQRGQTKLAVDLFKLSHHGSRQNMTDDLLDLIEPATILVCTDGSKFNHPDADALKKIRAHYPDAAIRFTDNTDIVDARARSIGLRSPTADQLPVELHFGDSSHAGGDAPATHPVARIGPAVVPGTTRHQYGGSNGVEIRGENLSVKLDWDGVAASRSGESVGDMSTILAAHNGADGDSRGVASFELVARATIHELEQPSGVGAGEASQLVVELGRRSNDEPRIVLVEENGRYGWFLPPPDADRVVLAATLGPPRGRGRLTSLVQRTVHVVALRGREKAAALATHAAVGAYDDRRNPPVLRSWNARTYTTPHAEAPDLSGFGRADRSLLVIHGFMGSIHGSFPFSEATVRRLGAAYDDRMIAFDHPTLNATPRQNAEDLLERLEGREMSLDILAHSRGGLVARELARLCEGSRIDIRSIVFVASPNGGTPLADPNQPAGLLDAVTNLVGNRPGSEGFSLVLEMLADVVVDGTIAGLDGLVAMQPGGEYLRELNRHPMPPHVTLRAIAAEYEPAATAGLLQTKYDDALDRYFGQRSNDRIVPTASAYVRCGAFQVRPGQRLVLDASRGVDHSSYWTDARTTRQLLTWLSADEDVRTTPEIPQSETDPDAEIAIVAESTSVESILESVESVPESIRQKIGTIPGGVAQISSPPTGLRDAVIVLPGIMGSTLAANGRTIWVDALRLARGGLADLVDDSAVEVTAVGLSRSYVPLITTLSRHWDVHVFPFDWRADIFESAHRLDALVERVRTDHPNRGINFVAHSMGGLVVRAFVAGHRQRWDELAGISDAASGRLVMLGTPNRGSYSIPMTLLGCDLAVRGLAAIDRKNSQDEVGAIVAGFAGLYQMLPFGDGVEDDDWSDLYERKSWGDGAHIRPELLSLAHDTHMRLAADGVDADRFCYVAGYGKDTPYRVTIANGQGMRIGQFAMGDGRVAHRLGQIEGMPMYFVDETHGGLITNRTVLDTLDDLVRDGRAATTDRFLARPPSRRGVGGELPRMLAIGDIDRLPLAPLVRSKGSLRAPISVDRHVIDDALSMLVGGESDEAIRPRISVKVVHASLEQTRYPVAVGHYARMPAEGAEGFLDWKLGGVLEARYRLGLTADDAGRTVVVRCREGSWPGGAIVVGLGEFGLLTRSILTEGITDGVLRLARMRIEAGVDAAQPFGLSSVLIGTPGRFGLEVETSMVAIIEGVMDALCRLGDEQPAQFDLEFIELYEQQADDAAGVLCSIRDEIDHNLMTNVDLDIAEVVETRDGGRPGAPTHNVSGRPWIRMQASLESPDPSRPSPVSEISVSVLSRQAQADKLTHQVDLDKLGDYVDAAINNSGARSVGHTLYELLLPHRVKLELGRSENIHLLVDEHLGQLPWELLAARDSGGKAGGAIALRAGFLRQLQSEQTTRQGSVRPSGLQALVIGDPPTSFGRLPGARREAGEVAELLRGFGWDVSEHISQADDEPGDQWVEIDNLLHAAPYRVVHVAAHGIFEPDDPNRSGVVTGAGPHHRLTAIDFRSMSVQPDLVFLNCCHLGRLDAAGADAALQSWLDPRQLLQPHKLAATVATQLMNNGVKAVVVAGWEVDDQAAAAFADRMYRCLLDAESFGDAIRKARTAAFDVTGEASNTWGAYQCYGDPDFQLVTGSRPRQGREPIVSDNQLVQHLQILTGKAGDADDDYCGKLTRELETLAEEIGDRLDSAHVALAIGDAYNAIGLYKKAAESYERCFLSPDGRGELRAIEQYANMLVRDAAADNADPASFEIATSKLNAIIGAVGATSGRLSLLGSVYKKLAVVLRRRPEAMSAFDSSLPKTTTEAVDLAQQSYREASALALASSHARPDLSSANVWLQLEYGRHDRDEEHDRNRDVALGERLLEVATSMADNPTSFWDRSGLGDTLLTMALLHGEPVGHEHIEHATQQYVTAFESRSTIRERDSVRTHLDDLICIFSDDATGESNGGSNGLQLIELLRRGLPSG